MIPRLYRPLVMGLLPVALIACMNSGPTVAEDSAAVPLGVDLGGSGSVAPSAQPQAPTRVALAGEGRAPYPQHRDEMQMAHAGHNDAHGTGTVNSVDPVQHKVNLSHNPIPEIGWPAMTMDQHLHAGCSQRARSAHRPAFGREPSEGLRLLQSEDELELQERS